MVVGAGPAGSAAAIAAARTGANVLLIDQAKFPRDKVCGDGIAPQALTVLADLGVDPTALVTGSEPVTRLRLRSPGGAEAARPMTHPAYVVPREAFDHRLLEAARATGVEFRHETVRSVEQTADGVLINGTIRARTVIGADGAESAVRRAVGARVGPTALAIRGYAQAAAWPENEQLLTMTRAHWPAYAWVFPIGDGRANVGYGELLRGHPLTRTHLIERMHALLPEAEPARLRAHRLPLSNGRPRIAHGRVLLAGDAAALINPITGEGIFYAVLSGSLAGQAATSENPATAYRRALKGHLGRHLRQTDVLARLGRWPALLDNAIAAARDDQHVFDILVELGLGDGRLDLRSAVRVLRP